MWESEPRRSEVFPQQQHCEAMRVNSTPLVPMRSAWRLCRGALRSGQYLLKFEHIYQKQLEGVTWPAEDSTRIPCHP
eukprot:1752342-Pleurochrysis_carterae.AAC.1